MAAFDGDDELVAELSRTLVQSRVDTDRLNDQYEGVARLQQLGLAIPPELSIFTVPLGWGRVTVDAVERRLDVLGFRGGDGKSDPHLWDVWQFNNMDERQTFAHVDALALARSYACIGTNADDKDLPFITVESPREMVAIRDPRTRKVLAALRLYGDVGEGDQNCTLYTPNYTRWLVRDGDGWVDELDPDEHGLGSVPVVPLVNRNRATRLQTSLLEGVSEMADVMPIAESAMRALTNLQLAQETTAVPQRGVLGATKGDFVGSNGEALSTWDAYFGSVWALTNKDAKTFQFDAANLSNFETVVNMYARLASGLTSLPIEYFGLNTQNAPSAEGQRAGETRHIKNAERKQTSFGHSWETVQRFVKRFSTGSWDKSATKLETIWRDAGTPTIHQVTDAVVKRFQVGLIDWETAQERMGETPAAIEQMKSRRDADLSDPQLLAAMRPMGVVDDSEGGF